MEKQNIKDIVLSHADKLKNSYHVPNIDVLFCESDDGLNDILQTTARKDLRTKGKHPFSESGFGMIFVPKYNTEADQPLIIVRTDQYGTNSIQLRNHLTHEFSNYEVWNRWDEEMYLGNEAAAKANDFVFAEFPKRVIRKSNPIDKFRFLIGRHPARIILRIKPMFWFPMYDSPNSIPADYVTMEKGFEDRLLSRKSELLRRWTADFKAVDSFYSKLYLSTSFPYLAYLTFHPRRKRAEERLEAELVPFLDRVNYLPLLTYIRKIRGILHELHIPVEHKNLFEVHQAVQEVYYGTMAEVVANPSKQYWGVLRDLVREAP